jgi:hypothetical protein
MFLFIPSLYRIPKNRLQFSGVFHRFQAVFLNQQSTNTRVAQFPQKSLDCFLMLKLLQRTLLEAGLLFLLVCVPAEAQLNTYIQSVQTGAARDGNPLRVSVALARSTELQQVTLYYRQFGQTEYRVLEMRMARDSAVVTIPDEDVTAPMMEMYVVAETQNGQRETYPLENPETVPFRVTVRAKSEKEQEILVLSPGKGESVLLSDIYISVSFVYASQALDKKKTKIFFDGTDVSSSAVLMGDLMIVAAQGLPSDISTGQHTIEVQAFDTTGAPYYTVDREFSVVSEEEEKEIKEKIAYNGNALAETRNEDIKGSSESYNHIDAEGSATYGILKTNANLLLTSEEKSYEQPQDRYFLGLDAKYVKVGLGDAYPNFPTTIMEGQRVRGVDAQLLLGAFNLDYATGQIDRRVVTSDSTGDEQLQSYNRTLTAVRPSFGSGENFQLGFSYLNAKDDFSDADSTFSLRPQENTVVGSDLLLAFDDHRVQLTGQTSLSLNNVDISAPAFTDDRIDTAVIRDSTISQSDGNTIKKYLPYVSKLILWNENLQPLNPTGLTSLVYETALALNYFDNYIKGTYIYHGKDYISVGTTALRNDVRGYNVLDRIRLMENKAFFTVTYERLQNNTARTEVATTTYNTFNTSLSYYPSADLPNVTVGYGYNKNANPIDPLDTSNTLGVALGAIDEKIDRYFLQSTYDFSSTFGHHNATMSFDYAADIRQAVFQDSMGAVEVMPQDIKSLNFLILMNTIHTFPFQSSIGLNISLNTIPSTDTVTQRPISSKLNYTTITINGLYKLFGNVLGLAGTISPTFGDYGRLMLGLTVQYTIAQNQSLVGQYQFIANSASSVPAGLPSKNDSYAILQYRINF